MNIEDLFFQLLQVAIGTRKTLDRPPTSQDWVLLLEMSKRQALAAVAFRGMYRLKESECFGISIDEALYLKWLGLTARVAQRNREVSEACVELVKQYAHDGLQCCILKGQGNLEYYPEELRECRTPGDIDVWCKTTFSPAGFSAERSQSKCYSGNKGVIEYVKRLHRIAGTEPTEGVRYHHIDAPSLRLGSGQAPVEVEVHFRPLFLDSPLRNWQLQRFFRENEQFGLHDAKIGECVFPTPTIAFNAVYQLCHIYRHLFDEGIGLRQLLDYYFVLRALHIEQGELSNSTSSMAHSADGMTVKSKEEIIHTLERFGMRKFASAVMYVLQTVFAMPDEYLLCPADEKEGEFLLNEIMMAGNFGKYDPRIAHSSSQIGHAFEKLKHNFRLIRHYPEEVLWEPWFRVYHLFWRRFELWRN